MGNLCGSFWSADFVFTANVGLAELTEAVTKPRMTSLRDRHTWRYNRSMGRYGLVDFAAHYQKGFRNHVVPISDVPALLEKFKYFGCYSSYFFYSDQLLTYMSARSATATRPGS